MGKLGDAFRKTVTVPFKALMPKNPWLRLALIAIPILLVLALLEPVLRLFEKAMDVFGRLIVPLLETPGGRLLLLNIVLLAVCVVGFLVLRSRIRQFRSGLTLRRHLEGIEALVGDQPRRARESFRRVAKSRALPPTEYPHVVEDAKLKLARIALDQGDVNRGLHWITRVKDRNLPKELKRSLAQMRAVAFHAQGEIDDATLADEVRGALDSFGHDVVLLEMLRDLARNRNDHDEAVALQEKVHKHALPRAKDAARTRLLHELLDAGRAKIAAGDPDAARGFARRAAKLEPESPTPGILAGEVALAKGDVRGAVREWGKTRSSVGLQRIAELLDQEPNAVSARELLESCPVQGAVLLVARQYARAGDHARAERAARAAVRGLPMTPSVAAAFAEVLELCGHREDSRQVTEDAVRRLVAPDA